MRREIKSCCVLLVVYSATACFSPVRAEEPVAPEKYDNAGTLNSPEKIGTLPKEVSESSGLIKSKKYAERGVFWTHNDSGDRSRIFAINTKGELLRTVEIPGAANVDWEEITMDDRGRLIICDCGDNGKNDNKGKRPGVVLYRLPEPDAFDPKEKIAKPEVFRFHFPDGKKIFDAEGAFYSAGAVYLFSKQNDGASCFKLPLPEKAPEDSVEIKRVAKSKTFSIITGASLSPDGKRLALINYLCVVVIEFPMAFEKLPAIPEGELPIFSSPRKAVTCFLGQSEAVAWDGNELVLTTEGGGIFRIKQ